MKQNRVVSKTKSICIIISIVMASIIIASLSLVFKYIQNGYTYAVLLLAIIGMLFAAILFVGSCINLKENDNKGLIFAILSILLFVLILLSGIFDVIGNNPEFSRTCFIILTAIDCISEIINLLFWHYQCSSFPDSKSKTIFSVLIYSLSGIYAVLIIVNIFTNILFYVDSAGVMQYPGILIDILIVFSFYLLYLIYILLQHCSLKKKLAFVSFAVFPLAIILITIIWYMVGLNVTVYSVTFTFLLLAAYVLFFCDYTDSRLLVLKQEAEIAEQKQKLTELQTRLMLSQIQPHFIFNALTAIKTLCSKDPDMAYMAVGEFSDYLRANMEALGSGKIIPFKKELEHIQTYLMLEHMRFGDDLIVKFDIQYEDFSLPALTVQPIVENAVRHGALMNSDGGVVVIHSEKTEYGALITITDNGPGFDTSILLDDEHSHYGISNTRNCLEVTKSGELEIESTINSGTKVMIKIWSRDVR